VARGRVVDEVALVEALAARGIAGAGIDVKAEEPLAASLPLWGMEHALITPHTAGETRRYEDNVIEIFRDIWGAFDAAKSNYAIRSSEAYRPQRSLRPCRNSAIAQGGAPTGGNAGPA
jgi:phosphoglycerate dehydrogenase-like enzyme